MQRGSDSYRERGKDDHGRGPRDGAAKVVVCRIGERLCAVPLPHVIETMRPLKVEPLPAMPPFVLGLAIIRGEMVPVVDVACVLGSARSDYQRFVTLVVGGRVVALAVGEVIGVRVLPTVELEALPPIVAESAGNLVAAITKADVDLILVLREFRMLADPIWAAIDERASA
ncbi:MAG: hypothetical protein HOV80_38285 [Polyangiaceae bacterium]|nr:hypothetical protein [Polyangiaceae bacterium]